MNKNLTNFKRIATLEGITLLVLLFIATPLKYTTGYTGLTQILGPVHGFLFVLYVINIFQNKIELNWNTKKTLLAILLSFVPLGTFYVSKRMIPILENEK